MEQTTGNVVSPKQLAEILDWTVKINKPLMVWGSPGIGKSMIIQQCADRHFAAQYPDYELNANGRVYRKDSGQYVTRPWCTEIRGSLIQSYDLMGIPTVVDGRTVWAPPEGTLLPPADSTRGGILFIDEIMNSEDENVRQALLGLVNDRAVGSYTLPESWVIVAASNRAEDGTFAHQMSKALGTRFFTHVVLEPDVDEWLQWAQANNVDYRTRAYIQIRRDNLLKFNAKDKGNSFPCPRIWVMVSTMNDMPGTVRTPAMIGSLGSEVGMDYVTFLKNFADLPSIKEIKAAPETAPIPARLDAMHMLTMALANTADFNSVKAFARYLDRGSEEWRVLFYKDAERLHPELAGTEPFTKWRLANGNLYV